MNTIVIVTDSMRADHLGCHPLCTQHNGKPVQTPNLDELAREGTLFEEAYGGSLPTIPMRTDCWTGRYGSPFHGWQPFRLEDYLLAEVLWESMSGSSAPGTFDEDPNVVCGEGKLAIRKLRPAGSGLMHFKAFINGWRVRPGDRLTKIEE